MTYRIERLSCGIAFVFDGKPDEKVRTCLKSAGFRWSPGAGHWWRRQVVPYADLSLHIDKLLHPGRPDGTCWRCGSAEGRFRNHGAATPVYCDACHVENEQAEADARRLAAVDFDMANNRSM